MSSVPIQAPKKTLVGLVNMVLDFLIEGLGANAAKTAARAYAPWLNTPVVSWIFDKTVEYLATYFDRKMKIEADKIVIKLQNQHIKEQYDGHIEEIRRPGATMDQILAARAAMDRLISRSN